MFSILSVKPNRQGPKYFLRKYTCQLKRYNRPRRAQIYNLVEPIDGKVQSPLVITSQDQGQRWQRRPLLATTDSKLPHPLMPGDGPDTQLRASLVKARASNLGLDGHGDGRPCHGKVVQSG